MMKASAMELTLRCPTCRMAVPWEHNPHRPFCSERCRLIDLGAWVTERYRVPGDPIESETVDDDDEDEST